MNTTSWVYLFIYLRLVEYHKFNRHKQSPGGFHGHQVKSRELVNMEKLVQQSSEFWQTDCCSLAAEWFIFLHWLSIAGLCTCSPVVFSDDLTNMEPLKESSVASKSGLAIMTGDTQWRHFIAPDEVVTLQGTGGCFHTVGQILNSWAQAEFSPKLLPLLLEGRIHFGPVFLSESYL